MTVVTRRKASKVHHQIFREQLQLSSHVAGKLATIDDEGCEVEVIGKVVVLDSKGSDEGVNNPPEMAGN